MATATTAASTPEAYEAGAEDADASQKIASSSEQDAIARSAMEDEFVALAKLAAGALEKQTKQDHQRRKGSRLARAGSDGAIPTMASSSSASSLSSAGLASPSSARTAASAKVSKAAAARALTGARLKAKLQSVTGGILPATPENQEVFLGAKSPTALRAAWTSKPSTTDTAALATALHKDLESAAQNDHEEDDVNGDDEDDGKAAIPSEGSEAESKYTSAGDGSDLSEASSQSSGVKSSENGAAGASAAAAAAASTATTKKRRGSVYTDLMAADKGRFLFCEVMGSPVSGGNSEPESASSAMSSSDPRAPCNRRLTATPSMVMLSEAAEALSESPSALAPMDVHSTGGVYQLRRQKQASQLDAHDRGVALRRQAAYGASHGAHAGGQQQSSHSGGRNRARSWTSAPGGRSKASRPAASSGANANLSDLSRYLLSGSRAPGSKSRVSAPEAPSRRAQSSGVVPRVRFDDDEEASTNSSRERAAGTTQNGRPRLDFSAAAIAARRSGSAESLQSKWRPPAVETGRNVLAQIFADTEEPAGGPPSPPSNASHSRGPSLRRAPSRSGSLRTLRRGKNASRVAVFKPEDEETGANKVAAAFGEANPERGGLVVGGGSKRERAAYLLDSNLERFSAVPETALVMSKLPRSRGDEERAGKDDDASSDEGGDEVVELDDEDGDDVAADKIVAKLGKRYRTKRGSLQRYMENDGSADDRPDLVRKASPREVHKIGILDLRIFNTDRHAGNILCASRNDENGEHVHLIPIDHALSLPDWHFLAEAYFDWQYWAQADAPFDEETKAVIASIDLDKDVQALQDLGLPESCIATNQITTIALQTATRNGFSLKDLGNMFQRPFCAGHNLHNKYFSPLEHMVMLAAEACHGPAYEPAGTHTEATKDLLYRGSALNASNDAATEDGESAAGSSDDEDDDDEAYDVDAKERAAFGNCPPPPGFCAAFREIVQEHTSTDSWRKWLSPLNAV